ncbi:hypothetical protein AAG570_011234 [Ranatra chinensis]|uniref:Peptidase C1A papain C-terminal domain-containing protein n=1 Tax=Ranatra chinensis TaxID=642074 RepID=A0ABD0YKA5_9HEMI
MNTSYHAPSSFDWRTQGVVSEVKNQETCGSCWAFTTTGVLESHYAIKTGERISLSEQYLIDCDISNRGCTGGNAYLALQFIEKTEIPTEKDYPYQGNDLQFCHAVDKFRNLKVKGIAIVTPTEEKLKEAVARIGPIAVGVDGNHPDFQFYYGGIYSNPYCLSYMPNHAMQVVGYGIENGVDYWIVKNSWGANWGEGGYVRMARNANNNCGIASYPLYPVM